VTPAPPPHERAWRHPSELPAPPHEPPTRGGRLLIVATATVGLALVGVMAIRMTPGQTSHRDALVTVTTSSAFGSLGAEQVGELAGAASDTGRRFTDLIGRTLSSLLPSTSTPKPELSSTTTVRLATFAVVTPIGTDNLGVTTAAAVAGSSGSIEAMLPSGVTVSAQLLGTDGGVAVVKLPAQPADANAASLADSRAGDGELTVVAFGNEFAIGDEGLRALAVPEAAPIFDTEGNLVGLCTIGPDGVEMLTLESIPHVEQPPPPDASEPEATVPAAEPVDSSVIVPSSEPDDESPTIPATQPGSTTVSTDVAATGSSVVASSEPTESSMPETTGA
jgi:hypothetical protein